MRKDLARDWRRGNDNIFQKGEGHSYSKYFVHPPYLFHVPLLSPKGRVQKVRKTSKNFKETFFGVEGTQIRSCTWLIGPLCVQIKRGGMRVRNLTKTKIALLGKWFCCFSNERESLWRVAISKKYGEIQGGGVPRKLWDWLVEGYQERMGDSSTQY